MKITGDGAAGQVVAALGESMKPFYGKPYKLLSITYMPSRE